MSEDTKLVDAINRVRAERKRLVMENIILREALDRIANDETDYPKQVAKEALQEVEVRDARANQEAELRRICEEVEG